MSNGAALQGIPSEQQFRELDMITKWKLGNFKSFRDETEIEMGPLTIFAGPNSSGKSAILQSILMIKQTLESRASSRALVLNGNLVRLGVVDQVFHRGSDGPLQLGWHINVPCKGFTHQFPDSLECVLHFLRPSSNIPTGPILDYADLTRHKQESKYIPRPSDGENCYDVKVVSQTKNVSIQKCRISSEERAEAIGLIANGEILNYLNYEIHGMDRTTPEPIYSSVHGSQRPAIGCDLEHYFPSSIAFVVDTIEYLIALLSGSEDIEFISGHPIPIELYNKPVPAVFFETLDRLLDDNIKDALNPPELEFSSLYEAIRFWYYLFVFINVYSYWDEIDLGSDYQNEIYKDEFLELESRFSQFTEQGQDHYRFLQNLRPELKPDLHPWIFKCLDNFRNDKEIDPKFLPFGLWLEMCSKMASLRIQLERAAHLTVMSLKDDLIDTFGNLSFIIFEKHDFTDEYADATTRFFADFVHYLGPLRESPRSVYPNDSALDEDSVGIKGEYTASILEYYWDKQVPYIPPASFDKTLEKGQTLKIAVADWLVYLDVAQNAETTDKGNTGIELKVGMKKGEDGFDLSQVGVGVSQVLPIIVMGLIAPKGATLIFEQPELHLHPKVQTLLADFFLSMSLLDKQCIVETHSEYLVNRIRYRIAASKDESLAELLKLWFVGKNKFGVSEVTKVKINRYGAIPEWPEGFFDQSAEEADMILRAAMLKRAAEGKGGHGDFSTN
jgi:predicted ATPase